MWFDVVCGGEGRIIGSLPRPPEWVTSMSDAIDEWCARMMLTSGVTHLPDLGYKTRPVRGRSERIVCESLLEEGGVCQFHRREDRQQPKRVRSKCCLESDFQE